MLRHALLLAVVLALAACGARPPEPTAAELLAALGGQRCVLDEEAPFGWIRDGLEPLRRARDAIASGDPRVRPLGRAEVRRRLAHADVVLFADLHDRGLFRRALLRLLREHADTTDLATGRIGLGCEAVAPEDQDLLRTLVAGRNRAELLALLRRSWPWPVEAYLDVWLDPTLKGIVPFAMGDRRDRPRGDGSVDDAARAPEVFLPRLEPEPAPGIAPFVAPPPEGRPPLWDDDWMDLKHGLTFGRKNERVAVMGKDWVRSGPGRRLFVIYGAAHLQGIREELERDGLRVAVVVPFFASWDRALLDRFGAAALHTVYEVLPGVLRVPVDPRELVCR